MVDRASGRASWTLDPYQVSISFSGARQQGDAGWFGPLTPIAPSAPADVAGRQWDYQSGYNLALQPRPNEPVTFATLRQLADGYDLLRLVIETRKDQVSRMAWFGTPCRAAGTARVATIHWPRSRATRSSNIGPPTGTARRAPPASR